MEIWLLAVALSCDTAALCVSNGARCVNVRFFQLFKFSLVYGVMQGVMPLVGFVLGESLVSFIAQIDHFIAFFILCFLGVKMFVESLSEERAFARGAVQKCQLDINSKELWLGAFATSIDALAVGVTFAFEKTCVLQNALIICFVCVVMSLAASYVGRFFGERHKAKALMFGGVVLVCIGVKILVSHLFF